MLFLQKRLFSYCSLFCVLIIYCLFFIFSVYSQSTAPKREFRGVWIATINNIDWPSRKDLPADEQRKEFIKIIEAHQQQGINAVIVQIRPNADAFYQSNLEPWSQWLNGKQGRAPRPFYDPLEFMIAACKRRSIEFHAWINPLRAVANVKTNDVHDVHITKQKPDWFLQYGNLKLFNPGIPAVRNYIIDIVVDIIKHYDVDGLHFDDYFYPYPKHNHKLADVATFYKYKNGFQSIRSWRRDNINRLIRGVHQAIDRYKPHVKFGISPFSVWRNKQMTPLGSKTKSGYTSYDHLYADVRYWLEEGWIDYVAPQVYQNTQHKNIPYKTVVAWWAENNFGKHVYVGQAAYRFFWDSDDSWYQEVEMANQLRFNRTLEQVSGSIFFSSQTLLQNQGNISDTLKEQFYQYPALLPTMLWKDDTPPQAPKNLTICQTSLGLRLAWEKQMDARNYVVYRFEKQEKIDLNNPSHIIAILNGSDSSFIDECRRCLDKYTYKLTALDRLHNESTVAHPSNITIQIEDNNE